MFPPGLGVWHLLPEALPCLISALVLFYGQYVLYLRTPDHFVDGFFVSDSEKQSNITCLVFNIDKEMKCS